MVSMNGAQIEELGSGPSFNPSTVCSYCTENPSGSWFLSTNQILPHTQVSPSVRGPENNPFGGLLRSAGFYLDTEMNCLSVTQQKEKPSPRFCISRKRGLSDMYRPDIFIPKSFTLNVCVRLCVFVCKSLCCQ